MNAHTDTELAARLQEDDVEAFDALYWKYHLAVYANIFKLIKEEEGTKDMLQEVFVALWEKRYTIDANQPVSGWLFVVSYNKSVSYLKKLLKRSVISNAWGETIQAPEESTLLLRELQLQLMEEACQQLSPQKRKVFELCKLQGKTYEEAASALNISKHTVKEYLSAAVSDVKAYVRSHPDHLGCAFSPVLLSLFL